MFNDNIFNDQISFNNFDHFLSENVMMWFNRYHNDERIIYPVGKTGKIFLDYMKYRYLTFTFCAIATKSTKGNNTESKFSYTLPVLPFEMLEHMKESALFVVAADPSHHDEIREELTSLGIKEMLFFDQRMIDLMKRTLKRMTDDGTKLQWSVKRILGKMREMEYLIAEQNEVASAHIKAFDEYKNTFRDKDVVILGNGPTLNYYKPIPNAIHIGLNRAWMNEALSLDFLFSIDGNFDADSLFAQLPEKYRRIEPPEGIIKKKIFLGIWLDKCPNNFTGYSEKFRYRSDVAYFYINNCGRFKDQLLYTDVRYHGMIESASVLNAAMQFAIYTYPKRLYIVGCDTTSSGHFFDVAEDEEPSGALNFPGMMKIFAARFKMFARLHYPETEIISINPVGLKGLFTDVYTDSYKEFLKSQEES